MTDQQKNQRITALSQSGGICEVCGKPLAEGQPQGAHRIGNTKERALKRGYHSHINPLTKKVVIAGVEDLDTEQAGMLYECN